MPINSMQWSVEVGIFNLHSRHYFKKRSVRVAAPVFCFFSFGFRFVFIQLLLFDYGDIELNPVLKTRTPAIISQSVIGI